MTNDEGLNPMVEIRVGLARDEDGDENEEESCK
jgi:hypothetical protein